MMIDAITDGLRAALTIRAQRIEAAKPIVRATCRRDVRGSVRVQELRHALRLVTGKVYTQDEIVEAVQTALPFASFVEGNTFTRRSFQGVAMRCPGVLNTILLKRCQHRTFARAAKYLEAADWSKYPAVDRMVFAEWVRTGARAASMALALNMDIMQIRATLYKHRAISRTLTR